MAVNKRVTAYRQHERSRDVFQTVYRLPELRDTLDDRAVSESGPCVTRQATADELARYFTKATPEGG